MPKQKLRYEETLPATGDAGDCGEIPNFEYKLRVRGTEKRKQRPREQQVQRRRALVAG